MLAWGIVLRLNHGHMFTVRPIIAIDKLKFDRIEDEKKAKLQIYWTIKLKTNSINMMIVALVKRNMDEKSVFMVSQVENVSISHCISIIRDRSIS